MRIIEDEAGMREDRLAHSLGQPERVFLWQSKRCTDNTFGLEGCFVACSMVVEGTGSLVY